MTSRTRFPTIMHGKYLDLSLRRNYIDKFYFAEVHVIPTGGRVLDLAGNRILKRGWFNIEAFGFDVFYLNLSTSKKPDVKASASMIPFRTHSFDAVICSELLEHVCDPAEVLNECARVLKPGGSILICTPFLNPIHADPDDFGRYTDSYWQEALHRCGYEKVKAIKQGSWWTVMAEGIIESGNYFLRRLNSRTAFFVSAPFIRMMKIAAYRMDLSRWGMEHPFFGRYTTGFGVTAFKRETP
jgi:SAM-dependent methyltransferase